MATGTMKLGLSLAEAGSHAKRSDGFYSPQSRPSCKFINFKMNRSSSRSENARVIASSQGFGAELSRDALSPPVATQDGEICDCRGGNLAAMGDEEMVCVQFVALFALGAELCQKKLSLGVSSVYW